jgi:alpha-D-ribose 1-methylphosphonate 5-triphosphate synthase subunit PhnH
VRSSTPISAGFPDPVHDAQRAFRSVLNALARPGESESVSPALAKQDIGSAMAHLLLSLTDDGTAVWWQLPQAGAVDWLRFHTGAPRAEMPSQAAFAVITSAASMPPLESFAAGSAESPEASTTLLVEVPSFDDGQVVEWHGPGIRSSRRVRIAGLPDDFWNRWQANHAAFPQGVDMVFTCADVLLGLPRTTRVRRLEGV